MCVPVCLCVYASDSHKEKHRKKRNNNIHNSMIERIRMNGKFQCVWLLNHTRFTCSHYIQRPDCYCTFFLFFCSGKIFILNKLNRPAMAIGVIMNPAIYVTLSIKDSSNISMRYGRCAFLLQSSFMNLKNDFGSVRLSVQCECEYMHVLAIFSSHIDGPYWRNGWFDFRIRPKRFHSTYV